MTESNSELRARCALAGEVDRDSGDDPLSDRTLPDAPRSLAHWAGPIGLFASEAVAFGLVVDPEALAADEWLRGMLWFRLIRTGPALAIAAVLLGLAWLRDRRAVAPRVSRPRPLWQVLLVQALAFSGFLLLTRAIEGGDARSSAIPGIYLGAWGATGGLALLAGGLALLPEGLRSRLSGSALRMAPMAAVAVAIGLVAARVSILTARDLWGPFGGSTLWAVRGLLGLIFPEVIFRPDESVLGTPEFTVRVNWFCAGYEGIGLIWAFLLGYLVVFRRELRFPQALLLLPLGTAVIWLVNAIRIAALVAVGVWISRDVALGAFHSLAGWVGFNVVALALVFVVRRLRFFSRIGPVDEEAAYTNPTAAYLAPLVVILAVMMVSGAISDGFDRLYPLRVLAALAVLWHFRRCYSSLRPTLSWEAVAIGVAVFVLWMALEPAEPDTSATAALASGLAGLPPGLAAAWVVFRVIGAVVTVPLAEELAFRGYLSRRLISAEFEDLPFCQFTWPSFLISSALFGALHGRWFAGLLAGMLYYLALHRRGELTDAVVAHAVTNALIAFYVVATGSWSLWA